MFFDWRMLSDGAAIRNIFGADKERMWATSLTFLFVSFELGVFRDYGSKANG